MAVVAQCAALRQVIVQGHWNAFRPWLIAGAADRPNGRRAPMFDVKRRELDHAYTQERAPLPSRTRGSLVGPFSNAISSSGYSAEESHLLGNP